MNILVDLSNICWIKRFGHLKSKKYDPYGKQLIIQETIKEIFKTYKQFKGSNVVLAVDSKNTWRKQMYPAYKATRDTEFDIYYDDVREAMEEITEFFNNNTNCYVLKVDECEADDVISTVVENTSGNLVLSSDKDFVQLLRKDSNVVIFNPMKKEKRTSENPEYELFVKCFRGDRGDNILNAYPGVRETRLKQAYDSGYDRANLLNEKRKDGDVVNDWYEFNRTLIDFDYIPQTYKDNILEEIRNRQENGSNNYSYVKVLRGLRDLGLKQFALETINNHVFILKNRSDLL